MTLGRTLLIFVPLAAACAAAPVASVEDRDPIDPAGDPVQTDLPHPDPIQRYAGAYEFTLTPLARYRVDARVLGRERYRSGWNALLSPVDLALAWGDLADRNVGGKLNVSMGGRWYRYTYGDDFPREQDYIVSHSANTHIIPADENLARAVLTVREGDLVELEGELVKIDGRRSDGYAVWWVSSLSRDDIGDGSCEVLYLERLKVRGRVYR